MVAASSGMGWWGGRKRGGGDGGDGEFLKTQSSSSARLPRSPTCCASFKKMIGKIGAAVMVGILGIVGWIYKAIRPPLPKKLNSVCSNRVKLRDGRYLAYREIGISKQEALYKMIFIHGFNCSKDLNLSISQEMIEELRIYILFFDRSGYGESDPNLKRCVKSEALDIEELADKLELGSKFYVMGISMGAYPAWSCLKYIPHRLAGLSLVASHINYYWPGFPSNLAAEGFERLPAADQWTFRVAHYAPWLFNWWMTQKWFPTFSFANNSTDIFSPGDLEILKKLAESPSVEEAQAQEKIRQQGVYPSLYQDIMAGHGKWEFDPMDIKNPFPNKEGSVHMWQGCEDRIIPFQMNRYIAKKLDWIKYHEIADAGHLFFVNQSSIEAILRELFLG
ncbi:hypothetical protein LguiA_020708 [Lonicera macranthoides]